MVSKQVTCAALVRNDAHYTFIRRWSHYGRIDSNDNVLECESWYLIQTFGKYFEKQDTHLRRALPPAKRLAVVLHWLAQASSSSELAALYAIGKCTVVAVVHQGIAILRERLVHDAILFPTGAELEQVMLDFESLCGLPCCGGAMPYMAHSCQSKSHQTSVIHTIAISILLPSLSWDAVMHEASSHTLMQVDLVL